MKNLLQKLKMGVTNNEINSPFSTPDVKNWVEQYHIKNEHNNKEYSITYIEGFLLSSTLESSSTKTDKALIIVQDNPVKYQFG